ncbi:MAG: ATP-binding protein [Isosphaeraceae bacterium]
MAADTGTIGREAEINGALSAWDRRVRILCIVADSGVGKSAVAREVMQRLLGTKEHQEGPSRLVRPGHSFWWSSYNRASGESYLAGQDAALADLFIARAIGKEHGFDAEVGDQDSLEAKGEQLAKTIVERQGLLILDGFERQMRGRRGDGVEHEALDALLRALASDRSRRRGLCIITSTRPLDCLGAEFPDTVKELRLSPLTASSGRELLKRFDISGKDWQLEEVAEFFRGHPQKLRMCAGFLRASAALFRGRGSSANIDNVSEIEGTSVENLMTAFKRLIGPESANPDYWDLLCRLSLFDAPPETKDVKELLAKAKGLSDWFARSGTRRFDQLVESLADEALLLLPCGDGDKDGSLIDLHQLVRQFGADWLKDNRQEVWIAGNRFLGDLLSKRARERVKEDPISAIAYFYAAMAQYRDGGDADEAFKLYWERIREGNSNTAANRFGIIAPEALEDFFKLTRAGTDWSRLVSDLKHEWKRQIFTCAAFELWHRGRLDASLAASDAAAAYNSAHADRESQSIRAQALRKAAETAAVRGDVRAGSLYARRAEQVAMAVHGEGDSLLRCCRATGAWVEHLKGNLTEALELFPADFHEREPRNIFTCWLADLLIDLGDDLWYRGDKPDLRLMSWGDGSRVPDSGRSLIVIGKDQNGLLHIRIFDAAGERIEDTNETQLPDQAAAIAALTRQFPRLLPPHELTDAETDRVIAAVTMIVGRTRVDTCREAAAVCYRRASEIALSFADGTNQPSEGGPPLVDRGYGQLIFGRLCERAGRTGVDRRLTREEADSHYDKARELILCSNQDPHIGRLRLEWVSHQVLRCLDAPLTIGEQPARILPTSITTELRAARAIIVPPVGAMIADRMRLYEVDHALVSARWALAQGRPGEAEAQLEQLFGNEREEREEGLFTRVDYGRRRPQAQRLRNIIEGLKPFLHAVSRIGQELAASEAAVAHVCERVYKHVVKHKQTSETTGTRKAAKKQRGDHEAVAGLETVEVQDRQGLRAEQIETLKERLGAALQDCLGPLLEEFGLGDVNIKSAQDRVWSLIESNIRAAHRCGTIIGRMQEALKEYESGNEPRREHLQEISNELYIQDLTQLDVDERQALVRTWNKLTTASAAALIYVDEEGQEHEVLGFSFRTGERNQKGAIHIRGRSNKVLRYSMKWPNLHIISALQGGPKRLNTTQQDKETA